MENVIFTPNQKIRNLQCDIYFINLYGYTFWENVKREKWWLVWGFNYFK